jgi:hypothetical protein
MERPPSIVNFERSFWASTLLGIGGFFYSMGEVRALVDKDPVLSQWDGSMGFVVGAILLSFALMVLLWYLTARRASRIAKWIYVILMAFGIFSTLGTISDPAAPKGIPLVISLFSTLFTVASIYFLFRPDARDWFARRRVDPATFN